MDAWVTSDGEKIVQYHDKYEPVIWKYYNKKKFWLKHYGYRTIWIIECKKGDFSEYDYAKFRKSLLG